MYAQDLFAGSLSGLRSDLLAVLILSNQNTSRFYVDCDLTKSG